MTARATMLEDDDQVQQHFRDSGWTDGLPIVAPTPERVAAMLAWGGFTPDQILGVEPVKSRGLRAEKVAINAVMAGCLPIDFPVVAAAIDAICKPELLVHGARRQPVDARSCSSSTDRSATSSPCHRPIPRSPRPTARRSA